MEITRAARDGLSIANSVISHAPPVSRVNFPRPVPAVAPVLHPVNFSGAPIRQRRYAKTPGTAQRETDGRSSACKLSTFAGRPPLKTKNTATSAPNSSPEIFPPPLPCADRLAYPTQWPVVGSPQAASITSRCTTALLSLANCSASVSCPQSSRSEIVRSLPPLP